MKAILRHNSYTEKTGKCNIAREKRDTSDLERELAASECILGGYAFRIQRVGPKTFTVRIYDDELADLGRHVLRSEGMPDDDISLKSEAELIEVGKTFRSSVPSAGEQKIRGCKVCRYSLKRLANRVVAGRSSIV